MKFGHCLESSGIFLPRTLIIESTYPLTSWSPVLQKRGIMSFSLKFAHYFIPNFTQIQLRKGRKSLKYFTHMVALSSKYDSWDMYLSFVKLKASTRRMFSSFTGSQNLPPQVHKPMGANVVSTTLHFFILSYFFLKGSHHQSQRDNNGEPRYPPCLLLSL